MRRYLSRVETEQALRAGRSIEQWLGARPGHPKRVLRWIRIDRERSGRYGTTLFEVFDFGGPDFLDLYEFPPVDVDSPDGVSRLFDGPSDAMTFACAGLGASEDRFVNAGVVQDEYRDSTVAV